MAEAVDAVEQAFADWSRHPEINLTRRRLHTGNSRLNTMPAALPSRDKIGLRFQTDMAHDWNSSFNYSLNSINYFLSSLDLHSFNSSFFDEPACIPNGFSNIDLI